jgi:hypothetical protein
MPAKKFLRNITGRITEIFGVVVSAGAANDGDIPALDAGGKLDISLMPSGIGASTVSALASEALNAGDFVNLYDVTGVLTVRKADATTNTKQAHGYVIAAVANAAPATVYLGGQNGNVTGKVNGVMQYLSIVPGLSSPTPPSASGNLIQQLGPALSPTLMRVNLQEICTVA